MTTYNGVTAKFETITPQIAEAYLKTMRRNRPPINAHIKGMARDMKSGEFLVNGEAVKFNEREELVDGQNRLLACILSGVTFNSLVVRGLPVEAQVTMDIGKARSTGDQIEIDGVPMTHKGLGKIVSSAFALVYRYAAEGEAAWEASGVERRKSYDIHGS